MRGRVALLFIFLLGPGVAPGQTGESPDWRERCAAELRHRLTSSAEPLTIAGIEIKARSLLLQVYARTDYQPLWHEDTSAQLVAAIAESVNDGLRPRDYPYEGPVEESTLSAAACAARELISSESLLRLAYSLRFGRTDPREISRTWNYPRHLGREQAAAWLVRTLRTGGLTEALSALLPSASWYQTLRAAHAALLAQAHEPEWPRLGRGPALRPGVEDPTVATLRLRLMAGEGLKQQNPTPSAHYDAALEQQVRAFQATHGLGVDGVVGPRTRGALDIPRARRIDQLRVNLERLRWIAHDLPARFLAVNIAAFEAGLMQEGKLLWRARTIVGRPYRQTPVFRARITSLEINPTWTVPPGILRQDVLPALRRDPAYLEAKGLQVLDRDGALVDPATLDWKTIGAGAFPYVLRQPPGEDNSLGRIKFLFPNPYTVYLHDTPARDLFARESRVFSSGCIRLERPFELARLLLAGDPAWPPEKVQAALESGVRTPIRLREPLPILLLYLTAYVDTQNAVHFRDDVYRRDTRVLEALVAPFHFSLPEGQEVDRPQD